MTLGLCGRVAFLPEDNDTERSMMRNKFGNKFVDGDAGLVVRCLILLLTDRLQPGDVQRWAVYLSLQVCTVQTWWQCFVFAPG